MVISGVIQVLPKCFLFKCSTTKVLPKLRLVSGPALARLIRNGASLVAPILGRAPTTIWTSRSRTFAGLGFCPSLCLAKWARSNQKQLHLLEVHWCPPNSLGRLALYRYVVVSYRSQVLLYIWAARKLLL
jgi:hypothetical protein